MGFLDSDEPEQIIEQEEDAVIVSLNRSNEAFKELVENKEEIKMEVNERVLRASEALKDAAESYKIAGVPAQSEDIRALAITFMIDEGKNARTDTLRTKLATQIENAPKIHMPTPAVAVQQAPRPAPVQSGVVCSLCGGQTYDNSGKKTNPKAPDYKCKNCNAVAWKSNPNKFHPAKTY